VRDTELPQRAHYDLDGEAREPMLAAFLAWVAGGTAPVHAVANAVRAQRTLEALYASSRRGGTPVRVGA
jgi:predicted dehydrogenase